MCKEKSCAKDYEPYAMPMLARICTVNGDVQYFGTVLYQVTAISEGVQ